LARVGVTGLAPRPFRAAAVETRLEGSAGTDDDVRQAAAIIANGVDANADIHASADYRKQMAQVYAARAIRAALARAS
jgi:carbon-monoxide dehydrogenase medium subunit